MTCDDCGKDGAPDRMVIDHLLPRSHRAFNDEQNLRMVHRNCNKKPAWYKRLWQRITKLFRNWQAERLRQREINKKLEALVDPTFLDRALEG